jgi:hypothetical protein
MKVAGYNDSVFINCPFDDAYTPLKIIRKISEARYGIHDLSRIELNTAQYPRFNMPFELGIFFGAKNLGDDLQKKKNALILERTRYSYQQYISDLNGIDTKAHNNDPVTAMEKVRDWLRIASGRKTIPGYTILVTQYFEFQNLLPELAGGIGFTAENVPFVDFLNLAESVVKIQTQKN